MRVGRILILTLLAAAAPATAASAATIAVTSAVDQLTIDGRCSLREAIFAAATDQSVDGIQVGQPGCSAGTAGEDTIQLPAGTYSIDPRGTGPDDINFVGDYDIVNGNRVRIVGAGAGATVIAGSNDRAFDVGAGSALVLSDLTIRAGAPPAPATADLGQESVDGASGGAVRNRGELTAIRVAFSGNAASAGGGGASTSGGVGGVGGRGGAIWSGGANGPSLTVTDSTFTGNLAGTGGTGGPAPFNPGAGGAGGGGGAIAVDSGSAVVTGSTFSGNRAGTGGGGGEASDGPGASGGPGGSGGAVALAGGVSRISSSTFAANAAGAGGVRPGGGPAASGEAGAVFDPGSTANIDYSTFAGNSRGPASAGANGIRGSRVSASILADAAPACALVLGTSAVNVALPGDPSCGTPRIDGDPRLGPLADNGGPTATMLPGAGSVAIDALGAGPCPATDQRGLPRPALGACDAGAVEIQSGAGGGGGSTAGRRTIARLTLGPSAFRTSGPKAGTTVRFTLGTAGRVVLTVTTPAAGRRSKGRCLAPTRRLAGARRCTRQVKVPGRLALAGKLGPNAVRFSGKLRGKALKPGAYTLVLTLPRSGASPAVSARAGFRILG